MLLCPYVVGLAASAPPTCHTHMFPRTHAHTHTHSRLCVCPACDQGLNCMFVDVEHALDPSYSKAIGVNMETLYVSQPGSGEEALEIADTMVRREGRQRAGRGGGGGRGPRGDWVG